MAFPFLSKSFRGATQVTPKIPDAAQTPNSWFRGESRHRFLRQVRAIQSGRMPVQVSAVRIDALEPRYLLSADIMPMADLDGSGAEYTLHFDTTAETFRLIDDDTGQVFDQRALADTTELRITGTAGNDRLQLDVSGAFPAGVSIVFDGGLGTDTLAAPAEDTDWRIDGHNAGTVKGLRFENVENLQGAADTDDTFVVGASGALDGVMDGGDAGFDSMELDGGAFDQVSFVATGPTSGTVTRDGSVLTYDGLEPVTSTLTATDVVIDLSAVSDNARLSQSGGNLTIESQSPVPTFEFQTFALPTGNLTINLGDDNGLFPDLGQFVTDGILSDVIAFAAGDILTLDGPIDLGAANLTIDGGAGLDQVVFDGTLTTSGAVTVTAEQIDVTSGGSVTASEVDFDAVAEGNGLVPVELTEGVYLAAPLAEIEILGAVTASTGNVSMTASATATLEPGQATVSSLSGALVVGLPQARVIVGADGDAGSGGTITAAGAVDLDAEVSVTVTADDAADSSDTDTATDAAISITTLVTDAGVSLYGGSSLSAGGAVTADAETTLDVTTEADGSDGGAGATVAVSVIDTDTSVIVSDAASISGASVALASTSTATVTTSATSTAGGATASAGGDNESEERLEDPNQDGSTDDRAETQEGSVDFAGAVSVSIYLPTTEVRVDSSGTISTTGGDVTLAALQTDTISATASGANTSDAATGVGVGVALGVVESDVTAMLGGTTTYQGAPTVSVSATLDAAGGYTADAEAGAGSSAQTGVAGALAINVVTTDTLATVADGARLSLNGAALVLNASATTETTTEATPTEAGGASGTDLGIGASVALYVGNNDVRAALEGDALGDGAASGLGALALTANGSRTDAITAEGGAAGDGTVIGGAIAIAVIDDTTETDLGTTGSLQASGDIDLVATHAGDATLMADGAALGGSTAVGAALALGFVDNRAGATARRDVTTTGGVSLSATGTGAASVTARAATTGTSDDEESAADADGQTAEQTGFAEERSGQSAGALSTGSEASAETSGGGVGIAAALALNVSSLDVVSAVKSGAMDAADLTLASGADMDATSTADGSASDGSEGATQVGVAVAITVADVANSASVDAPATVLLGAGGDLSATAGMAAGGTHVVGAEATSGASGGDTGVAGSFALSISGATTRADMDGDVTANGGDVSASAEAATTDTVAATAAQSGASATGVGASVAISVADHLTVAELGDNAILSGADSLSLMASGAHDATTTAEGGAAAGDGTGIGGALAIDVHDRATTARIGAALTPLTLTGAATLSATHAGSSQATATGSASGNTAVGVSLALAFVDDAATTDLDRDLSATSLAMTATGTGASVADATASAEGTSKSAESGDGNTSADDQIGGATQTANDRSGDGDTTGGQASAASSGGSVAVGAAVAVNVSSLDVTAVLDGVDVTGATTLASAADMDAEALADGSAATGEDDENPGSGDRVGVAVAINVGTLTNEAGLLSGAVIGAFSASATMAAGGAHLMRAEAKSGASGGETGVAGSFALLIANGTTRALQDGSVSAGGGDVSLDAAATTTNTVKATAAQSGAETATGVGASIAISVADHLTVAEVTGDVLGADDLSLTATGAHTATTEAEAGAQGSETGTGIGGGLAIDVHDRTTRARIGAGAETVLTGAATLTADHSGTSAATMNADASGNTAVGAAIALSFVSDTAEADLDRDLTATALAMSATGVASSAATSKASAKGTSKSQESSDGNSSANDQRDSAVSTANARSGKTNDPNANGRDTSASGTGGGAVAVGAALSLNVATLDATAVLENVAVSAQTELDARARMDASASADGSAAKAETSGTADDDLVGVAVAINVATLNNAAGMAASASVTGGFSAEALMAPGDDGAHTLGATAISGATGGNLSVAGSFALSIAETDTAATLAGDVSAAGADVTLGAASTQTTTASATAAAEQAGETGVGASIAIGVSNMDVDATIADAASVTGADAVTLSATGSGENTILAEGGAESKKSGSTAVGGGVAIAVVDQSTEAAIGIGDTLETTGSLSLSAIHHGKTETTATGKSTGSTAVGASVAVGIVTDAARSSLSRDLHVAGDVSLDAHGDGASLTNATASATGVKKSAGSSANSQESAATSRGNQAAGGTGSSGKTATGKASKGGSDVSVAAAIAVNVQTSAATATIDGALMVDATGTVAVRSSNNTDSAAQGDGSASTTSQSDAVGVGVAVNVVDMDNEARIMAGTDVSANGLTLGATMKDVGGNLTHSHVTKASSGASGGDTGIAGSFAVAVVNSDTVAIMGGANSTLALTGGAVDIDARSDTTQQTLASAKGLSKGKSSTGVGAGIALTVTFDTTDAGIENGTVMTGTANGFAVDVTSSLLPTEDDGAITEAQAGAAGNTAVGGGVAVTYIEADTDARIGTGTGDFSMTGGALSVTANRAANYTTRADGEAAGGNVGVGASVALNIGQDDTDATVSRAMTTGTNTAASATVATTATVASITESKASAKGQSKTKSGGGDSNTSDEEVTENTSFAQNQGGGSNASSQTGDGMFNTANTNATDESGTGMKSQAGGSNSSGGTSVAATVSVNFLDGSATAEIADGADLAATGAVSVKTTSQLTAKAIATATSTDIQSNTGVAAAVGLNITLFDSAAKIGTADVSGGSVEVAAVQPDDTAHVFNVRALAGAVSSGTGVGGSISINFIDLSSEASIGDNASVSATNGDLDVIATNRVEVQNLAGGAALSAKGSGTGVGIAVSVNIVEDLDTDAEIGAGAEVSAEGGATTVSATASFTPYTDTLELEDPTDDTNTISQEVSVTNFAAGIAAANGGTAVGGSASVNVIDIDTNATIGTGADVAGEDGVTVSAQDILTLFTGAGSIGLSIGGSGVGVAINVDVVRRDTLATIEAGADVYSSEGDVSVTAHAVDDLTSVAATFGASSDSVAAAFSIGVAVVLTNAKADIQSAAGASNVSEVSAGGDVTVAASGHLDMLFISGGAAASLSSAGIGIGSTVLVHTDTVEARIGESARIDTAGAAGLTLSAQSSENILDIVVGAGVSGGSVAVGGSVLVTVMNETTRATIADDAVVEAVSAGASDPGVALDVDSHTEVLSVAGALGLSAGSAGIGAGVNVHTITKTTEATLGDGVSVRGDGADSFADGNIEITADSTERVATFAVAAAAGSSVGVGVGADVMVMTLTTTAAIGANASVLTRGSVKVQAVDETEVDAIVVGASAGGSGGVGAGVGVAVITKTTEAMIGANADVSGLGETATTARIGDYDVGTVASGTGVSTDAFEFDGARPDADDFEIGLPETDVDTDLVSRADSGDDPETESNPAPEISDPGLTAEREATLDEDAVSGVVVSASGKEDLESYAIGFAAGGTFGIGIGAAINVVDTTVNAAIGAGAQVNRTGDDGADAQSVVVNAVTDFSHVGVGTGVGIGGTAAVAPGVDISTLVLDVDATIGLGAAVEAENDVVVSADAKEDFFILGVGAAVGGTVGIGGGVAVVSIDNEVDAGIGADAIVVAGGDVAVSATDNTEHTLIVGGAGFSGVAGIGLSVDVVILEKDTNAYIGDRAQVDALGAGTGIDGALDGTRDINGKIDTTEGHGVIVLARSSEDLLHLAFAAGAGTVGVAGAVNVTVVDSDTFATVGEDAQINRNAGLYTKPEVDANQGIWIGAANELTLVAGALGIAGGFVGVGASVNYTSARNDTGATVGAGADLTAKGSVNVISVSDKVVKGYVAAGGAGVVGVSGAINVLAIGSSFDSSYTDDQGNTEDATTTGGTDQVGQATSVTDKVAQQSDDSLQAMGDSGAGQDSASADGRAGAAAVSAKQNRASFDLSNKLAYSVQPEDGTSAVVLSGATIKTAGNVSVSAEEIVTLDIITGSAAGGFVGVGAGVTVVTVNSAVRARLGGATTAGGTVSVSANGERKGDLLAVGVQAGAVAVGATVNVVNDRGQQLAEVTDGGSVDGASLLSVTATNDQDWDTATYSVVAGAAAVGVNFSRLNLDDGDASTDETIARIGTGAEIGQTEQVGAVSILANSIVDADSTTYGVTAGLVGVGINFAYIDVTPQVLAEIGNGAKLGATGAVSVTASSEMDADAFLLSVSVGAVGIGSSYARAIVSPDVTAALGSSITADIQGLSITATHNTDVAGDRGAKAEAQAGSGGIVGGAGATPTARANADVAALIGTGGDIDANGGAIMIRSDLRNRADADALAVSVGAVAVGASVATAEANGSSVAESFGTITGGASLQIEADANNSADVFAEASGGGLVAIFAHTATATTTPTIRAKQAGDVTVTGFVQVLADSLGQARAENNSVSGGIAGAGVGIANATLSPNVTATIASGTISAGSVLVRAQHNFGNIDTNIYRAYAKAEAASVTAGGVTVNEAHAVANGTTVATIGGGAEIDTQGDDGASGGNVTVAARASNIARGFTDGLNVGILAAVGTTQATATASGTTRAEIEDGTDGSTVDIASGALTVEAEAADRASARVNAAGGGIISASFNTSTATSASTITARIGEDRGISAIGAVKVSAKGLPEVDADTKGVSGGGIDVAASQASATLDPTILADIASGTALTATGAVTISAAATLPDDSERPTYIVQSTNGGAETLSVARHGLTEGIAVELGSSATRAYNALVIDAGTIALGNALSGGNIDAARDEITFARGHNFQNGDEVRIVKTNGTSADFESAAGTSFFVAVIDSTTIKLVDDPTKAVAGWYESNAGTFRPNNIDSVTDEITLSKSYSVGDVLTYRAPGGQDFGTATVDVNTDSELTANDNDRIVFIDEDGDEDFTFRSHGFSNGDLVVYTAEATEVDENLNPPRVPDFGQALGGLSVGATYEVADRTSSSLRLKAALSDAVTYVRNGTTDSIVLQNGTWFSAGFRTGQSITISGSVDNNGTYTIASLSGATLTLSGTEPLTTLSGVAQVDTFRSNTVELSPDKPSQSNDGNTSVHTLTHVGDLPIDGLVDGQAYYVVAANGNDVKLSESENGPAINLSFSSATNQDHLLGEFGIDLNGVSGDDTYELRVDLDTGDFVGQKVFGEGGLELNEVAPQSGDGVSSAVVTGSGGGLISAKVQFASLNVTPDVDATVSAALVSSDETVSVSATADVEGSTNGRNGNGGLIAVGLADTLINQGADPITANLSIGNGTQIVAKEDVLLSTNVNGDLVADSKTTTGGGIGIARAKAKIDGDFTSAVAVSDNAVILAGDLISATSDGAMTGRAKARGTGIGFGGDGDADADFFMSNVDMGVSVGANAIVEGNEVSLVSNATGTDVQADADGRGAGFYAEGTSDAKATYKVVSDVSIASGAEITGWEGVDFRAIVTGNEIETDAFARSTGLFGYVRADTNRDLSGPNVDVSAQVVGAGGALVTAGPRDESASGDLAGYDYDQAPFGEQRLAFLVTTVATGNSNPQDADVSRRSLAAGDADENGSTSQSDIINFNSDVLILSGRSPDLVTKELTVGAGGRIEKAVNVTINDGAGREAISSGTIQRDKIYVNDIVNPGPGDVAFDSSAIVGAGGTWTFRETLQRVEILNLSALDIQINDINVLADRQPIVTLNPLITSETMTLTFDIEADVSPTFVQIASTGDTDIELNGIIENPIGVTNIVAQGGSVIGTQSRGSGVVRTQTINIDAAEDAGTLADRVVVDIVESAGTPETFSFRTSQVNGLSDTIFLGLANRFHEGQMVRYDANGSTPLGGLVDGNFYYISFDGDAFTEETPMIAVKLYDNAELSGDAVAISQTAQLSETHGLTGVESFTVDAGNDIALDVRALLRDDVAGDYLVEVDRIAAGNDADVLLRPTYEQTGAGLSGGVIVKHRLGNIDPAKYVYYQEFVSGDPAPGNVAQGVSRGAYGSGTTERDTTYDFRGLDPDGDRTIAGLQAGAVSGVGNVNVVAAENDPSDTTINVLALTEIDTTGATVGDGHVSVDTNGWIAVTEIAGDFRVGTINSTGDDVLLYSPMSFVDAQGDSNAAAADISGTNLSLIHI